MPIYLMICLFILVIQVLLVKCELFPVNLCNGKTVYMLKNERLGCFQCDPGQYWSPRRKECKACPGSYTNIKANTLTSCKQKRRKIDRGFTSFVDKLHGLPKSSSISVSEDPTQKEPYMVLARRPGKRADKGKAFRRFRNWKRMRRRKNRRRVTKLRKRRKNIYRRRRNRNV